MGAKITLMGSEWISLDGSLPEVQKSCYFLDRENVFRGVMDEQVTYMRYWIMAPMMLYIIAI